MFPYLRFQLNRRWRRLKRNSRIYRAWLVNYFYRHIWGKWRQLGIIRRFTAVWWGLAIVILVTVLNQSASLKGFYLIKMPQPGGVYVEGVVGEIKGINPILPDNSLTEDAGRLVFSGLTRLSPNGELEPELAESWQVSDDGLKYIFTLRKGVKWHDGVEMTAADVVFTISAIQHPDSRSPLAAEWRGVKVEPAGDNKISFNLPNPYVGFIHLTTVGILPRHLLESINPSTLRIHSFNQQPVGTGPFKVTKFLPGQRVVMEANPTYLRGRPKLDGFTLRLFKSDSAALEAFAKKQVNAVSEIKTGQLQPASKIKDLKLLRYNTTEQINLFLKTSSPLLSEQSVRQALVLATNKGDLVANAMDNYARPLSSPILPGQLGFAGKFNQPRADLAKAEKQLDDAGWKKQGTIRKKGNQELKLKLVTLNDPVFTKTAAEIERQWKPLGIGLEIKSVDLSELIQSHIKPRQYDALLFGITIGADPDIYPYWHSSQRSDPGLNLSQYQSSSADAALEVARITVDKDIRAGKYQTFSQVFQTDAPAVILFGKDYTYGVHSDVLGQDSGQLVVPADRFYGIEKWTVNARNSTLK